MIYCHRKKQKPNVCLATRQVSTYDDIWLEVLRVNSTFLWFFDSCRIFFFSDSFFIFLDENIWISAGIINAQHISTLLLQISFVSYLTWGFLYCQSIVSCPPLHLYYPLFLLHHHPLLLPLHLHFPLTFLFFFLGWWVLISCPLLWQWLL